MTAHPDTQKPRGRRVAVLLGAGACVLAALAGTGPLGLAQSPAPREVVDAGSLCEAYWAAADQGSPIPLGVPEETDEPGISQKLVEDCVLTDERFASDEVSVWEDRANDLLCVSVRRGEARGDACTRTTETEPMISGVGTVPSAPVVITILDPQHRLGIAEYEAEGRVLSYTEMTVDRTNAPDGAAIAAEVEMWPEVVTVYDRTNDVVMRVDTRAAQDAVEGRPVKQPETAD